MTAENNPEQRGIEVMHNRLVNHTGITAEAATRYMRDLTQASRVLRESSGRSRASMTPAQRTQYDQALERVHQALETTPQANRTQPQRGAGLTQQEVDAAEMNAAGR